MSRSNNKEISTMVQRHPVLFIVVLFLCAIVGGLNALGFDYLLMLVTGHSSSSFVSGAAGTLTFLLMVIFEATRKRSK